jgi:hypothetical protein
MGGEGDRSAPGGDGQGLDIGGGGGSPSSPDIGVVPGAGQPVEALPLSRFAGAGAKTPAAPGDGADFWDVINRVKDGGLPEPASWALMLIGFATIGGALRGLVVANRRLARLQPDESEDPGEG